MSSVDLLPMMTMLRFCCSAAMMLDRRAVAFNIKFTKKSTMLVWRGLWC